MLEIGTGQQLLVYTASDQTLSLKALLALRDGSVPVRAVRYLEETPAGVLVLRDTHSGNATSPRGPFVKMTVAPARAGVLTIGICSGQDSTESKLAILLAYRELVRWLQSNRELPFNKRKSYRLRPQEETPDRPTLQVGDYEGAINAYLAFKRAHESTTWAMPSGLRTTCANLAKVQRLERGIHRDYPTSAAHIRLS
jgi:hypothetical protein